VSRKPTTPRPPLEEGENRMAKRERARYRIQRRRSL